MKSFTIIAFAGIMTILLPISSCKKDNFENNETKISSFNDDESHKTGENCMSCHVSGGEGEAWFTVAGSVYDADKQNPYANATIKLYSEATGAGNLIKTIEVDSKGNFYTTEAVDFSSGLYTSVISTGGNEIFMIGQITSGACNSCHGNSIDRIWVD